MGIVMVRYRVKTDRVEENERLVGGVYEELAQEKPDGFRYGTFKLDDGASFMHLAVLADGVTVGRIFKARRVTRGHAVDVDADLRLPRGSHADARLLGDARGSDAGVR